MKFTTKAGQIIMTNFKLLQVALEIIIMMKIFLANIKVIGVELIYHYEEKTEWIPTGDQNDSVKYCDVSYSKRIVLDLSAMVHLSIINLSWTLMK